MYIYIYIYIYRYSSCRPATMITSQFTDWDTDIFLVTEPMMKMIRSQPCLYI